MKKRSLSSILIFDILTLGFYELYWLWKTRNEMVAKPGITVPNVGWLLLTKAIQISCLLITVYIVLYAIPANNRRIDNLVRPSPSCLSDYAHSADSVMAGGQQTVDQECKDQVDEYDKDDNSLQMLEIVFGLYVVSFVLLWITLKRWYVPYAEAVANVTQQQLNSTTVMLLITLTPSPLGMLRIQDIYNRLK